MLQIQQTESYHRYNKQKNNTDITSEYYYQIWQIE